MSLSPKNTFALGRALAASRPTEADTESRTKIDASNVRVESIMLWWCGGGDDSWVLPNIKFSRRRDLGWGGGWEEEERL